MTRKILLGLFAVAVLASLAASVWTLVERSRTRQEILDLRDRVARARISADSCTNVLAYDQMLFQQFDRVVDSLRGEVRVLEELDPRGVPEERYDEYMERFEGYNDSVAAWERRAEQLRASDAVCRTLIEAHNTLSDSVRGVLESMERKAP
ncbi:MAG TPA: hypothetical protein VJ997_09460 [Longimicrobiales bacterium]|nr:hypothetical protein [Longimicrobiales bacterium]